MNHLKLTKKISPNIGMCSGVNWNGKNFISICEKVRHFNSAFDMFIHKYMSIMLDESVLELEQGEDLKCMPGEVHIKDKIPARYFKGIVLPNILGAWNWQDCKELGCDNKLCTGDTTWQCTAKQVEKIQNELGTNLDVYLLEVE